MSKSNFLLKAEVLENGIYDAFRYIQQTKVAQYRHFEIPEENPYKTLQDALDWELQISSVYPSEWKEAERLYKAKCARATRLAKRLRYMIRKSDCCFVTLTFSDEVLSNTSAATRHEYVKRWLRLFPCAIANIDFGSENGREHYHAVVLAKRVRHESWKYGLLHSRRVKRTDERCVEKLAHYTAKLVNHAIKETTKGCRTIYSGYFGLKMPTDHIRPTEVDEWRSRSEDWARFVESEYPEEFIQLTDEEASYIESLFG